MANGPDLSPWYHHNLDPIALSIGSVNLPWYWLVYVAGWFWCAWIAKRCDRGAITIHDKANLRLARDEFLLWGWIGLICGARLVYVVIYNPAHYISHPDQLWALWNGGMSFHGGFLGVALAAMIVARRRGISVYILTDPIALAVPWILFLGRIANFANGELAGRVSTLPWAVVFPAPFDGAPRHPSQIYEALIEGLLVGFVLFVKRRAWLQKPGLLSFAFTGLYAAARFFVEFTREPDPQIGLITGLTMGQWLCLGMMTLAIIGIRRR